MKRYKFISDSGHGWLRVPIGELEPHEYTRYSYRNEDYAFLEEDCDAGKFLATLEEGTYQIIPVYMDGVSWIRNLGRIY